MSTKVALEPAAVRLLKEHLPYELDMMDAAYRILHAPECQEERTDRNKVNAAIEVFWIHVRNLLEFMRTERRPTFEKTAAAADFTDTGFPCELDKEGFAEKMNDQIAHLHYERVPGDDPAKLNAYQRQRAKAAIDKAMNLFVTNLSPAAKDIWEPRTPLTIVGPIFENATSTATVTQSLHIGWTGRKG